MYRESFMLQRRMAGILLTVIVAVLAAVPVQSMCMYRVNAAEPDVESPSVILMEASTGKTVYEKMRMKHFILQA